MNYIKELLKCIGIIFLCILLSGLFITTLSYFDIASPFLTNIWKWAIPLLSMGIGGFLFGKAAKKNGWIEGLKLGIVAVFLITFISVVFFSSSLEVRVILYDMILIACSVLGGMIGIGTKTKKES